MSESKIMLSVHMITYNHEKYIAQAIDSVLNQNTKYSYEIVIGEDCSTDKTLEIIKDYKDKYPDIIKLVTADTNVGMLQNYLRVTKACIGKYVAFLEGDDYWHNPNKIDIQLDFMERNPEYGIVSSDIDYYFDVSGKLDKRHNYSKKRRVRHGEIYEELIKSNFIKTPTVCVRRDLLVKHDVTSLGITRGWKMGDLPQWLALSMHTKYYYENQSLTTYRICEESASHIVDPRKRIVFDKSTFDIRNYFAERHGCKRGENFPHRLYVKALIGIMKKYRSKDALDELVHVISNCNYELSLFEKIKLFYYKRAVL